MRATPSAPVAEIAMVTFAINKAITQAIGPNVATNVVFKWMTLLFSINPCPEGAILVARTKSYP